MPRASDAIATTLNSFDFAKLRTANRMSRAIVSMWRLAVLAGHALESQAGHC
jgi:hypothetical protein